MNGWSKFFILLAGCILTLIFFPYYDRSGWSFMGMFFVLWTCLIVLCSVIVNLFAIYKVEFLHRLISILFILAMLGSLLYYFPLEYKQTPYSRLKNHQWPTSQDIENGIKRLTFNFDFVRRNVHRDANYVNQQFGQENKKVEQVKKQIEQKQEALDILVEPFISEEEEQ